MAQYQAAALKQVMDRTKTQLGLVTQLDLQFALHLHLTYPAGTHARQEGSRGSSVSAIQSSFLLKFLSKTGHDLSQVPQIEL